jgi:hypothetical protein
MCLWSLNKGIKLKYLHDKFACFNYLINIVLHYKIFNPEQSTNWILILLFKMPNFVFWCRLSLQHKKRVCNWYCFTGLNFTIHNFHIPSPHRFVGLSYKASNSNKVIADVKYEAKCQKRPSIPKECQNMSNMLNICMIPVILSHN